MRLSILSNRIMLLISLLSLFPILTFSSYASVDEPNGAVYGAGASNSEKPFMQSILFEDGSHAEIRMITFQSPVAANVSSGSKCYSYYSSSDVLLWRVILNGTFSYDGRTATCISASTSNTMYDSQYSVLTETTTKSGNTASTTVIIGRKLLSSTIPFRTVALSLSCDKDGNLS